MSAATARAARRSWERMCSSASWGGGSSRLAAPDIDAARVDGGGYDFSRVRPMTLRRLLKLLVRLVAVLVVAADDWSEAVEAEASGCFATGVSLREAVETDVGVVGVLTSGLEVEFSLGDWPPRNFWA